MFVYPKWLKVSNTGTINVPFEVKDLDSSMSEIFRAINGGLSDENFAEIPYEAIAWFGEAREAVGSPPSWSGHIHDGISARRLAGGHVRREDLDYDGSLGVLNHPESDAKYVDWADYDIHGGRARLLGFYESGKVTLGKPSELHLFSGKLSFSPGVGGGQDWSSTLDDEKATPWWAPVTPVPVDMGDLDGILMSPVVVATIRAEMKANTLPEKGMPNTSPSKNAHEELFMGMGVGNITLFRDRGVLWMEEHSGDSPPPSSYYLQFHVYLPCINHPISEGVSRWWIDWMMLARVVQGAPPEPEYS